MNNDGSTIEARPETSPKAVISNDGQSLPTAKETTGALNALQKELEALRLQVTKKDASSLQHPNDAQANGISHFHDQAAAEQGYGLESSSDELQQIQLNRKELLETGIYTENDELIIELDMRIQQLLAQQ